MGDALFYSKAVEKFGKSLAPAAKEIATNGKMWKLYQALGGLQSTRFDYYKGIIKPSKNPLVRSVEAIEHMNIMLEQLPRFAEFLATIGKDENPSYAKQMQAMYNAADITVNFGRSGWLTRILNKTIVPFMNPSVQAVSKAVRTLQEATDEKDVKKAIKLLLSLIAKNALVWGCSFCVQRIGFMYIWDEETKNNYELLTNRDRDMNYIFPLGDGRFVKMPKGRLMSVFGSGIQRSMRYFNGKEDFETAFKEYLDISSEQAGPPNILMNNVFSGLISMWTGKNWFGGEIVPGNLANKAEAEQYDQNTDIASIFFGQDVEFLTEKD